jgi:hypothetical protein
MANMRAPSFDRRGSAIKAEVAVDRRRRKSLPRRIRDECEGCTTRFNERGDRARRFADSG